MTGNTFAYTTLKSVKVFFFIFEVYRLSGKGSHKCSLLAKFFKTVLLVSNKKLLRSLNIL